MRTWIKQIIIPFSEFEPGCLHTNISAEECERLRETDDGCPECQDELEAGGDLAIEKAERGKYEFVDIMLTNRPGLRMDEDSFWNFNVELTYR